MTKQYHPFSVRPARLYQILLMMLILQIIGSATGQAQDYTDDPVETRLLVATTRRLVASSDHPKGWFSGQRGRKLVYAELIFKKAKKGFFSKLPLLSKEDWEVDQLYIPAQQNAARDFATVSADQDIMLYVHGYRETFESAARSTLHLAQDIKFSGQIGLFAWPSSGSTLDYGYDRESALWSRLYFKEFLENLGQLKEVGDIHIVAHSMGTLLTLETLKDIQIDKNSAALSRIGAIVLASPDVDLDIFQQAVENLGKEAEKITVITAENDRALALSSILSGGKRAGMVDRERLEKLGVRVADASEFGGRGFNHDLFLSNRDVVQVVRRAMERSDERKRALLSERNLKNVKRFSEK